MKIELNKIRIDGGTQSRVSIVERVVKDYTEVLLEGKEMSPVQVFFDGVDYWLADGFHRYHAHKGAKCKEINCDVTNGTKRDAKIYSLGANDKHGLQRTNEDKRKSVETCLDDVELSMLNDVEIAKICNVSPMTVGRIKKGREIDRIAVAPKVETELKEKPSENTEVEEYEDEDKLTELATENRALAEANIKLKDQLAIKAMPVSEDAKVQIEETLDELRAENSRLDALLRAMTISRNDFQRKANEAMEQVKYWKRRAEKAEKK